MLNKIPKEKKLIKLGEKDAVEVTYETETVTPPKDIFEREQIEELLPTLEANVARAQARLELEQAKLDELLNSKLMLPKLPLEEVEIIK